MRVLLVLYASQQGTKCAVLDLLELLRGERLKQIEYGTFDFFTSCMFGLFGLEQQSDDHSAKSQRCKKNVQSIVYRAYRFAESPTRKRFRYRPRHRPSRYYKSHHGQT